jgi:hypothetical protein
MMCSPTYYLIYFFSKFSQQISEPLRSLVKRSLNNAGPYDPIIKEFAMNINYYSNTAYNGLRTTLKNILPHLSTIKRWYKDIDGSPGFTRESLNAINRRISSSGMDGQTVVVALSMDEMAVRKHIVWDPIKMKFVGHVSFSTDMNDVASKALVFMLTGVNSSWKIPIGYFYVNGFDADKRTKLLIECLQFINSGTNVDILSMTFDGDGANIKMVENLGANLKDDDLNTTFVNPITNKPIHVILDGCHMIKLVRNNLAKKRVLYHGNDKIEWR